MSKIIISPSILSADFANLERDIKRVEESGADWLHVDVMDGHFVPNISIGVPVVKSIKPVTKLPLDVHLMISEPERYAEPFAKAGADILTYHYEVFGKDIDKHLDLIEKIRSLGCKAGVSIKPKTKLEEIVDLIEKVDLVLVMTVEPGFGGQKFMEDCAKKIPYIKEHGKEDLIIQVDGGINSETAKICRNLGANSLVAGNYIYKSDNLESAIASLRY